MSRRYLILDVFTDRALGGNPLAVVLNSDGLDEASMQHITREFNLSETVFILPPKDPANRARIRIFTTAHELPFAGHPTVGASIALALEGGSAGAMALEEAIGIVKCEVATDGTGSRRGTSTFVVPRASTLEETEVSKRECADALSLEVADIGFDAHRPVVATAGVPFLFVPVANLTALARARPDESAFIRNLGAYGEAMYLYTLDDEGDADFRSRMFSPGIGSLEDPATGAAAAAFPSVLMDAEARVDGHHRVRIDQGVEMGRPSRINLAFTVKGGAVAQATIGGSAIVIAEGTLHV
ncbi:phenazine biosynthesis protein [Azorhizobium caulinodans ORS 571]|uniref:Phenazine biosynthesis protein n=1 Tax=Azorhizobium caulinodans (strain ATCC 43989 / DSM 5975 / JCM 20966 / LMG 6465 / NBRC 14845 / NCIMB 13405 / ORS 571) TaxID=438753 RepID=A8HQU9_AZOC5|nr:PhzF family phenazine biosynthesis protein [Azorhizobium caulinodans]BAF87063.1 phenazine biosynthesis protein [Azorhizobium caulinodans ORS 571]